MAAPYRNYDTVEGALDESFVLNQQRLLTSPVYEREALVHKPDPIDVFGYLGQMRQAGMMQFTKETSAHQYSHVEVGRANSSFDYAAQAAPGGTTITLTVTGEYGMAGTVRVSEGDIFVTGVGLNGKVTNVTTAANSYTVELESITGVWWPAMPAGKADYIGHPLGESEYAPARTMQPAVAAFDHIPMRVGFGAKFTNFVSIKTGDWVMPPRPMASPWREGIPNMPNNGWQDHGLDVSIGIEVLAILKYFYYGQRSGTPRAAGDEFYTDGLRQVVKQRGIVVNVPTVVTRQWAENVHSAKSDVVVTERDIRVVAGVNVCNLFNRFVQSEMNGSFAAIDRNSPYDYRYKGFSGVYGDSMFSWTNLTMFDDLQSLGQMGGKDLGFSINATMPSYMEYTGTQMADKPNASLVSFRPSNSKIYTDGARNTTSWVPIHYGTNRGLDYVPTSGSYENNTNNDLEIQFAAWFASDFRCMDLSILFQ